MPARRIAVEYTFPRTTVLTIGCVQNIFSRLQERAMIFLFWRGRQLKEKPRLRWLPARTAKHQCELEDLRP